MDESVEFSENLGAFVRTQRRIVDDFGRSLSNARHFLNLAHRSLEREPDETVTMLQQIREIDLLGHLSHQFDEYRGVAGLLLSPPVPSEDPDLVGEVLADWRRGGGCSAAGARICFVSSFGGLATLPGRARAHAFASPPLGGFALS